MPVTKSLGIAGASLAITLSGLVVSAPAADAAATGIWKSCTALNARYAHGVGKATARDHVTSGTPVTNFFHSNRQYKRAMNHNRGLDRDKDGIACEKH